MRVRISYGIDLESAPTKVSDLVTEAVSNIESRLDNLKNLESLLMSEEYVKLAPSIIDNARKDLADVDQILADAYAIIGGYVNVKEEESSPSQEEAATAPPPSVPTPESDTEEVTDVLER